MIYLHGNLKGNVWTLTIRHFGQQTAEKRLANQGYHELPHTPGIFRNETRQVWFTVVVDNFGIKYVGEENANHLFGVLRELYEMEENWTGGLYCGITPDWHYKEQYVDITM